MDIRKALQELADEIKVILEKRIEQYGVNPKTGTNTLHGSELEKSLEVFPTDNGIALQIASYWEFVSRGWKRTHNYAGTMGQFIKNISDWITRKGIDIPRGMTHNQFVWAIITNIMNNGLKERPFMVYDEDGDLTKMIPELNDIIDSWFDKLFDDIMSDIEKYFSD